MSDESRTALTFHYERWRGLSSGVLETAGGTFLLLIAVRWYHAGAIAKALVADGGSLGLLMGPLLVSRVKAAGWPVAKGVSRLAAFGALCFVTMAAIPILPVFVIGAMFGMACTTGAIPFMTQIYQENYPVVGRGRLISRVFMIRIATAVVFSWAAGYALSGHIEFFRWLLLMFAAAFGLAGYAASRIPSRPLTISGGTHPFQALRYVRDDALFRRTLIMWMFMGFGNLMALPLRVEYLANHKYGVTWHNEPLSVAGVALLTSVVPNIARLCMSPVWGWLFDRMNFFTLRVVLNVGFATGILSFFGSGSITGMVLAAVIYGVSIAGGDVAWSLWVTKFAPADRVADYMSVHTFFTGMRGVIAPLVAFQLVARWSPTTISWFGAGLILVATTILIPEIKFGKRGRKAAALVEEVSE